MRLRAHSTSTGSVAEVTLSRRNLLALLHKLEMPRSGRTLMSEHDCSPGWTLVVRAEDDPEHYADRRGPGPVHPSSEVFIDLSDSAGGGLGG